MTTQSKPSKIAYLVHALETGGIEQCVINLSNHLNEYGYRPFIFSLTSNGEITKKLHPDIPVFSLSKSNGWDSDCVKRLSRLLTDHKIDILHTHNWGTLIEGCLARKKSNTPVHVHTEHGQGLHSDLNLIKRIIRRQAYRWAAKRLNKFCVCAKSVAPLIAKRTGIPEPQFHYLPNGVPATIRGDKSPDSASIRQTLSIPEDSIVFGCVGRLVPVKGYDLAIRLVRNLKDQNHGAHLIIVGDGEARHSLQELAGKTGVSEHIHFVGHQNDVGKWLHGIDVFLNTSHSEAMSLSVLEAMSAGKPIIATDVGDNQHIVLTKPECGDIPTNRTVEEFVKSAKRLISDKQLRARMGENAFQRFEMNYSIEAMVQQHCDLYARCLTSS